MSQDRRMVGLTAALSLFVLAVATLFAPAFSAPAVAAEDKPGARASPPGVLVEPRPKPKPAKPAERDSDQEPSGRDRRDGQQGCPTNDRPLELLV